MIILLLLLLFPAYAWAQPADIAVDYPVGETELEVKEQPQLSEDRVIFALDRTQWPDPGITVYVYMLLSLDNGKNYDAMGLDKDGNPIPFCAFTARGGNNKAGQATDMTIVNCPLPGKSSPERLHKIYMIVTGGTLTTITDQATYTKQ